MAPVALADLLALGVTDVRHDVATTVGERRAGDETGRVLLSIASLRLRPVGVELDPLDLVAQPEVDDTGNRVGAVHSGRAAGHHLDTFDQRGREDVQVHRATAVGRHESLAIHQHQGLRDANAAQREIGLAVVRRVVGRAGYRRHELRQHRQRSLDGHGSRLREGGRRHGNDRARRREIATDDARAGDLDLLERRVARTSAGWTQDEHDRGRRSCVPPSARPNAHHRIPPTASSLVPCAPAQRPINTRRRRARQSGNR